MITKNTVIVIGAGASADLGMPLGHQLKSQVASTLLLGDNEESWQFGSALTNVFNDSTVTKRIKKYAMQFHSAIMESASIDNFLDQHRANTEFVEAAKLAITYNIAKAEHKSSLGAGRIGADFLSKTNKYFLIHLLNILVRGHTKEDFQESFKNLSFITFNYDRCLQKYLEIWAEKYFSVSHGIFKDELDITHIYGSIGDIFKNENTSPFRYEGLYPYLNAHMELPAAHGGIRLFTEQETTNIGEKIRAKLDDCEALIFIGFGFEEQNMRFFSSTRNHRRRAFATVMGQSQSNQDFLSEMLTTRFLDHSPARYRSSAGSGKDLIDEHYHWITRAVGSLPG